MKNFTSWFGRLHQNIAPKSVPHVQHDEISSFNESNHWFVALLLALLSSFLKLPNRELKQPRRRRQQERHKFTYLTKKNNRFARFARAFFIFLHFADVLVYSTTWNYMFCSCVDEVSIWWEMFTFVFLLTLKRLFQFNPRIVRKHFASLMTWIIAKWLQKPEVTFSDDVLAVFDVVFA